MREALFFVICSSILCSSSLSRPIVPEELEPRIDHTFKVNTSQNDAGSCSYTVSIKTSCSSVSFTRDQISLAFGDAYGNQVYVPRIDDPSSRTFERCSRDTFEIQGPCTYQVCYVYLYRSYGYDGWKPATVTVYGTYYSRTITFYYNTFVPRDVWFGFNHCGGFLPSKSK